MSVALKAAAEAMGAAVIRIEGERQEMEGGRKTWYFPDGYLPEKNEQGPLEAHEALMLFNTGAVPVKVLVDFYFENRSPVKDVEVTVGAERVRTLRLDLCESFGGPFIPPLTQYALRVRADAPIVAQFGRIDTTQTCLAYYGTPGYAE